MRKSDLTRNHGSLDEAITRYRQFMKKVIGAQRVIRTAQEKRDVAESVLLRLCAHWERFVDEHIVDCVNCDSSALSAHFGVTLPTHPSWDLCHALIIGDGYTNFRSFDELRRYSKKILPDISNPFLAVKRTQAKRIDEVYRIRNYLSHYSKKARASLNQLYRTEYSMRRFMEPGQFVLSYKGRRLWTYFDAFANASSEMKAWYVAS